MIVRIGDAPKTRCIKDLLYIYAMDTYPSVKGYLQKLVDLLYKLGYYEDNKSLFSQQESK